MPAIPAQKGATAVITTCSLTVELRPRDGKPRRCLTSRRLLPRTGSPGVWPDPSPYDTFECAVAFIEGMGGRRSSQPKARQSTDVAARTRYRYACRISRAWEFGVARAGANGMSFNKTEAGAGATTSGRATAAEVSIDRQIDPQDQFANCVIPQVLPPQSGSFCHRRWSFSTPSRAADTAREGHSGSGESDLGDMDSYAKVLDRVPRRLREG